MSEPSTPWMGLARGIITSSRVLKHGIGQTASLPNWSCSETYSRKRNVTGGCLKWNQSSIELERRSPRTGEESHGRLRQDMAAKPADRREYPPFHHQRPRQVPHASCLGHPGAQRVAGRSGREHLRLCPWLQRQAYYGVPQSVYGYLLKNKLVTYDICPMTSSSVRRSPSEADKFAFTGPAT